ncbi:exported hypothetical protein [Candidatus Terasakiella magnetica]|nr:exported hypothetical protein [Candidatus Terasakiella magnetica]
MMSSPILSIRFRSWLRSFTALVAVVPGMALANPQGGTVAEGAATITTAPSTVTVNQSSNRAVINWQSFSIAAGETTRFNQPSSSSVTLNRVTGAQVSQLLGTLSANGQVYLVNPNGIVFGKDSKVDVAALVASTHDIKNANFMAANLRFDIPGAINAQIINQGNITVQDGGLVALVAPGVQNSGIISARLGKVGLAAANGFTLDLYGDNLILFQAGDKLTQQVVGSDGKPVAALLDNSGKIYADGGRVLLSANVAKSVVDKAVNMTGIVQARSVEQQNGEIILRGEEGGIVEVAGTLDASGKGAGQKGGSVQVLGEKVGLVDNARIDVSGDSGGGTALVGGDAHGTGPVPNAQYAYMAQGASIDASAITTGNGGKAILWSDMATRSYGSIFAKGGAQGGDGGFVETSGKLYLSQTGSVDASAAKGKAGTWLLDPGTIYIQSGVVASNISTDPSQCTGCTSPYTWNVATAGPAYIDVSTINNALSSGNNVWVNTGFGAGNAYDIYVNSDIVFTHGLGATKDVLLRLEAARNVYVTTGRIYESGTKINAADLNVSISAGNNNTGLGAIYIGDISRTISTIIVGSGVDLYAPTTVQIYGTNKDGVYTINSKNDTTIRGAATPNDTTKLASLILGKRSFYINDLESSGDMNILVDTVTPSLSGTADIAISGKLTINGVVASDGVSSKWIEWTKIKNPTTATTSTATQQATVLSTTLATNRERVISAAAPAPVVRQETQSFWVEPPLPARTKADKVVASARAQALDGEIDEAVRTLASAATVTPQDIKAVFADIPPQALVHSLTASPVKEIRALAPLAQTMMSGKLTSATQTIRMIRAQMAPLLQRSSKPVNVSTFKTADSSGVDSERVLNAYVALMSQIREDARNKLFGKAVEQLRLRRGVTPPTIPATVTVPTLVKAETVKARIEGQVDGNRLAEVRVNGRWTRLDDNGRFQADVTVAPGLSSIPVRVTDSTGAEHHSVVSVDSAGRVPRIEDGKGRRVAVLIGVETYSDKAIPTLETPIADIKAVGDTLRHDYGFEAVELRNASKQKTLETIASVAATLAPNDQLMLYYAGHGYSVDQGAEGYWLPADASIASPNKWISNTELSAVLRNSPAQQIMLVSDSCYSGTLTQEHSLSEKTAAAPPAGEGLRSVMVLSSGGNEPVADADDSGHSPFATALIRTLREGPDTTSGMAIFGKVQPAVANAGMQTPQFGALVSAGYDPGGDFRLQKSKPGQQVAASDRISATSPPQ